MRIAPALLLSLILAGCGGGSSNSSAPPPPVTGPPPAQATVSVTIDGNVQNQRIDGFGSSQRVWADPHVGTPDSCCTPNVPLSAQDQILRQLYEELGLTRVRMHGAGWNTEPLNDNADPLTLDSSKFAFACSAGDGCSISTRVDYVKQAIAYGLQTALSENNPNATWMNATNPTEYAENTLALLLYWRETKGYTPQFQTLANEPSQNFSFADGFWFRDAIKALGPRMRAAGLNTMLVIPDELGPDRAYPRVLTVLQDPEARQYVGAIAYHLYSGGTADMIQVRDLAQQFGVPIWMTEYYWAPGYSATLDMANRIYDLVTQYRVSAFDYMWGFFGQWVASGFNEEDLIAINFDSRANYLGHQRTSKYYMLGQFSRHVRPGAILLETRSNETRVKAMAFRHPGTGTVTLVAINNDVADLTVAFNLQNLNLTGFSTVYRTSATENWQALAGVAISNSTFTATLKGSSVTTFTTAAQ